MVWLNSRVHMAAKCTSIHKEILHQIGFSCVPLFVPCVKTIPGWEGGGCLSQYRFCSLFLVNNLIGKSLRDEIKHKGNSILDPFSSVYVIIAPFKLYVLKIFILKKTKNADSLSEGFASNVFKF